MDARRIGAALLGAVAGRRSKWVLLAAWAVGAALAGPWAVKLHSIVSNEAANYLPTTAQSTLVERELSRFPQGSATTAVIVYASGKVLNSGDLARIARMHTELARQGGAIARVGPIVPSPDRAAALFTVTISRGEHSLIDTLQQIRRIVEAAAGGLKAGVTGPAAYIADNRQALRGIDRKLLLAAATAVVVVLVAVYRTPLLAIAPLITIALAIVVARGIVYGLSLYAGLTVTTLAVGVLDVLVFGAGTDYAILLIARYREELRRDDDPQAAMARALPRVAAAITPAGTAVILSLLCLLAATLNSDRGLGPVTAVGIFCCLGAALSLLPALLLAGRRWILPHTVRAQGGATKGGVWVRIGEGLARHPRRVWIVTILMLALLASGLSGLHLGLPQSESFIGRVGAVQGQRVLERHFPAGVAAPMLILTNTATASEVVKIVEAMPKVSDVRRVAEWGGRTELAALVDASPESGTAFRTIAKLRQELAAIRSADALVGGADAVDYDLRNARARDRRVVMPLVLVVVMAVLGLSLRSLVAPLVLVATVILSYAAALGSSTLAFDWGFRFGGVEQSVPLDAFILLVALGIDYNIFLMSRARQEAGRADTRIGMQRALARTGVVITAAGVVLSATFATLALVPLVILVELGFTISFGILLDTFVVRSILVPSIVLDIGKRIWWPSRLGRQP